MFGLFLKKKKKKRDNNNNTTTSIEGISDKWTKIRAVAKQQTVAVLAPANADIVTIFELRGLIANMCSKSTPVTSVNQALLFQLQSE